MSKGKESWVERKSCENWLVIFAIVSLFITSILIMHFFNLELSECQEGCSSEKYAKELEKDLLFYYETNRGLHFLDEEGCEWRIVIEPATAYVDCKAKQQPVRECVEEKLCDARYCEVTNFLDGRKYFLTFPSLVEEIDFYIENRALYNLDCNGIKVPCGDEVVPCAGAVEPIEVSCMTCDDNGSCWECEVG